MIRNYYCQFVIKNLKETTCNDISHNLLTHKCSLMKPILATKGYDPTESIF